MDQKNTHPSLNHQAFSTCFEVKKEVHQNDETFQHELQVNSKAASEHNYPQQFPEEGELQGFSNNTAEKNLLSKSTSRRALLTASALAAIGMTVYGGSTTEAAEVTTPTPSSATNTTPTTSSSSLQKLLDGNLRFQRGQATHPNQTPERRQAITKMASPLAIVVSCVEARVPPEIIFDQGLGDLIVYRTPAHVADDLILKGIDLVMSKFPVPLIVILGNSKNGTVKTVMQTAIDLKQPGVFPQALVSYLSPSILKAQGSGDARLTNAIKNNIIYTVKTVSGLKNASNAIKAGKLNIVGCYYDVDTGAVSVLKN